MSRDDKNMFCFSKNNYPLIKFQIFYPFLKDTRANVRKTSIRIDTSNPGY